MSFTPHLQRLFFSATAEGISLPEGPFPLELQRGTDIFALAGSTKGSRKVSLGSL